MYNKYLTSDDVFLIFVSILLILSSLIMTTIHEAGHVIATILLGGKVLDIHITFLNGGYVISHFDVLLYSSKTIVLLSGGLAVALLFLFLGFFNRIFLFIVPFQLMDGLAEALGMSMTFRSWIMTITMCLLILCYIRILVNHDIVGENY